MKVLIVDNYDSFTYNLFHIVQACNVDVNVVRNDQLNFDSIEDYDKIILSPGPGLPSETKNMFRILEHFAEKKPMLGVCLGMQGMAEFFGAQLENQESVKHGVQEKVIIQTESKLFNGVPRIFSAGLYHSWKVDAHTLPHHFIRTSYSENDVLMSMEHTTLPLFGVQFHPESILTEFGEQIMMNFLNLE